MAGTRPGGIAPRASPRALAPSSLVHPNNPTGHFTKPWERRALEELCREHGLALIVDEVFLDYAPWSEGGSELRHR